LESVDDPHAYLRGDRILDTAARYLSHAPESWEISSSRRDGTFCPRRESKLRPRERTRRITFQPRGHDVRTILLVLLILLLLGALPTWPYSTGWGYYPSGGLGLVLLIVVILVLAKRI